MMHRRRFLTITAAAMAAPALAAAPVRWRGRALGAEVSLTFYTDPDHGAVLLQEVKALLREIEAEFSLYDPASALSRLNRSGRLAPSGRFLRLMSLSDQMHGATGGLFDPTIQPLWSALANGGDPAAARAHLGWSRVAVSGAEVRLDPGQALTFNGIAQGFATDVVRDHLGRAGLTQALINIGEFAAIGGPFRLGMADPDHGLMSIFRLTGRAVATSSVATPVSSRADSRQTASQSPRSDQPAANGTTDKFSAFSWVVEEGYTTGENFQKYHARKFEERRN